MNVAEIPFTVGIVYLLQKVLNSALRRIIWFNECQIAIRGVCSANLAIPYSGDKLVRDRFGRSQRRMDVKRNSLTGLGSGFQGPRITDSGTHTTFH